MKSILFSLIVVFCCKEAQSQTLYAEAGAVGSFFKESWAGKHAFGAQVTGNYQFANGFLLGAGVQALWFDKSLQYGTSKKGYYPVYAKIGYNISTPRLTVSFHADEGYSIHKSVGIGPADGPVYFKGGFYFSPGIALYITKKFSPYIDVKYTNYQFRSDDGFDKNGSHISAVTISAGICILHKRKR